jgi:hypothetical protein
VQKLEKIAPSLLEFVLGKKAVLYRLYKLAKDGHLLGMPDFVEAADDKEAIERAIMRSNGFDLELWDLSRRVALIPAKSSSK